MDRYKEPSRLDYDTEEEYQEALEFHRRELVALDMVAEEEYYANKYSL